MPNKEAHLAAAKENQEALDYLLLKLESFSGWVATVAFYKALHLMDALCAVDGTHHSDHKSRNGAMKRGSPRQKRLYKHYRALWQASRIARYLKEYSDSKEYDVFADFMPPAEVKRQLVDHRLRQIEKSVLDAFDDKPSEKTR